MTAEDVQPNGLREQTADVSTEDLLGEARECCERAQLLTIAAGYRDGSDGKIARQAEPAISRAIAHLGNAGRRA